MASISKIVGAGIYGSQENSVSLANIHFDFSLMKVDAPAEYAGLGSPLSKRRKGDAEGGDRHVVARKLGALFESGLPHVPNLIRAYGCRVTEIAESQSSGEASPSQYGPFADHAGVDGSTIWAAATSGRAAIAVHLLGCMLGSIWSQSESVAVWVELVKRRKEVLCQSDSQFHPALELSRIDINREQLTQWDTSVRSWLRTAEKVKRLQQTQLRLITNNISIPVAGQWDDVYGSVMEAWISAMIAMENLLQGQPQRIQNGPLMMGLFSWHLYPDMSILGDSPKLVVQHDPLFDKGGVITVAVHNDPNNADEGFYWSLPLSHLRYYGKPIVRTRRAGLRESQATFEELLYVALGSLMSTWDAPDIRFEIAFKVLLSFMKKTPSHHWLRIFEDSFKDFLKSKDEEKKRISRYLLFGLRKSKSFLARPEEHPSQVLGLADLSILLKFFNTKDSKIETLRKWARDKKYKLPGAIIRFFVYGETDKKGQSQEIFTELVPRAGSRKRDSTGQEVLNTLSEVSWIREINFVLNRPLATQDDILYLPPHFGGQEKPFRFVAGIPQEAAIYEPIDEKSGNYLPMNEIDYFGLDELIRNDMLATDFAKGVITQWSNAIETSNPNFLSSIEALRAAQKIYKAIPDALVDLQVTGRPLHESNFAKDLRAEHTEKEQHERHLSLETAFACVAFFETGYIDLHISSLEDVMALCYGDSIFMSQRLISDPNDPDEPCPLKRITGSIDKSGLALLVPPPAPEIRSQEFAPSQHVDYNVFDGKYEDSFRSTSLHLRFTGAILPVDISANSRGFILHEASFVETVVQVFDGSSWLADLDVLKALSHWQAARSAKAERTNLVARAKSGERLVSIDHWDELLDEPPCTSVFRGFKNPLARLAALAILSQLERPFIVLPKDFALEYKPDLRTEEEEEEEEEDFGSKSTDSEPENISLKRSRRLRVRQVDRTSDDESVDLDEMDQFDYYAGIDMRGLDDLAAEYFDSHKPVRQKLNSQRYTYIM